MFMGWRMADDLETLSQLPNGELRINILEATCEHSEAEKPQLRIADEIKSWFLMRLKKHRIPVHDIVEASLVVQMKNNIPSDHKKGIAFVWTCNATIATSDRQYNARLAEPHAWIAMP